MDVHGGQILAQSKKEFYHILFLFFSRALGEDLKRKIS